MQDRGAGSGLCYVRHPIIDRWATNLIHGQRMHGLDGGYHCWLWS